MSEAGDQPGNSVATQDESAELVRKLEPLVRPEKKQAVAEVVTMYMRKVHIGPLPAPEDLEQYDRIAPGSANRIIDRMEKEQAHRHKQEGRLLIFEYGTRLAGQMGAMVALLAMLGTVMYCAYIGQPMTAAVIGAVGTIVIGFLKYSASQVNRPAAQQAKPPAKRKRK